MNLEPLFFDENRHTALWGYERWLISVRPQCPSVIKGGTFAGKHLDELASAWGTSLLGTVGKDSPLLIKEIDAHRRLSIQVHPDEQAAALLGSEPKTEMWHVLSAVPDGALFAGLKAGTTRTDLERALIQNNLDDIILRHPVTAGMSIYVPAGLVHAIGEGVRVFEVQQSSETTYRLSDWGRVDAVTGKPRTLHVAQGLASVHTGFVPSFTRGTPVISPFFTVTPRVLEAPMSFAADVRTFRVVFAAEGDLTLTANGQDFPLPERAATLIPALLPFTLTPRVPTARVLLVTAV